MFLNFLDDIFLQNLAFKSPQCTFNGLAFVNLNLRHLFCLSLPLFVRSSRTDSQFQTSCSARQSELVHKRFCRPWKLSPSALSTTSRGFTCLCCLCVNGGWTLPIQAHLKVHSHKNIHTNLSPSK